MNFDAEVLARLAWTQIWQITLLIVLIAGVTKWCCRRKPYLSYMLWMLVIIKCLTPPVWGSPTGIFSWVQRTDRDPATSATAPAREAAPSASPITPTTDNTAAVSWQEFANSGALAEHQPGDQLLSGARVLIGVWAAGAITTALIFLIGIGRCLVDLRRSQCKPDRVLSAVADDLRKRLGIRRPVRLVVTLQNFGPAAFGVCRPTIVLPQRLVAGRTAASLTPIIAHELVHIRRGDTLIGIVQMLVGIVWWFHPLVWWANRQIAEEREQLCDEQTIACLNLNQERYSQNLIDVLKLNRQVRPVLIAPGVRALDITRKRLEHIMNLPEVISKRMPHYYWLVLLVGAVVVLPGGGLTSTAADKPAVAQKEKPDANRSRKPANAKDDMLTGSGMISQLPPDGTRAVFDLEGTVERNGRNSPPTKGEISISAVGREMVDGVPCRWIEIAIGVKRAQPERSKPAITKLLIPENRLTTGADPLAHIVKGWSMGSSQTEVREVGPQINPQDGPLHALLPGRMTNVKSIEKKSFKTALGVLECDGLSGSINFEHRDHDVNVTYKIFRHKEAPFGVVSYQMQIENRKDGRVSRKANMKFTLREIKKNAESEVPK